MGDWLQSLLKPSTVTAPAHFAGKTPKGDALRHPAGAHQVINTFKELLNYSDDLLLRRSAHHKISICCSFAPQHVGRMSIRCQYHSYNRTGVN